jgi:hypothetical protein
MSNEKDKKSEPKPVVIASEKALDAASAKVETPKVEKSERMGERKERARETIAFMLVFGLLALFISSFLFAGTVDEAIKLIQAISSALSGMIGAVLGYYYGTEVTKRAAESGKT